VTCFLILKKIKHKAVTKITGTPLTDSFDDKASVRRMLAVSTATHVFLIGFLVLTQSSLFRGASETDPDVVMSIRLGGPEGPGEGGLTPLGGRPVQELLPLQEASRPQWIQPPTPTQPEMVLPVEEPARRLEPDTEVQTVAEEARGRTPTKGPELLDGSSMADTGLEGIGVGLSGGGLGGSSGEISLSDFCCPDYLSTMIQLIRRQWNSDQEVPGVTVIRFTIARTGIIEGVGIDRSSGYLALDMSAQRAVLLTTQLPPLPSGFTGQDLTVTLTFEYRR